VTSPETSGYTLVYKGWFLIFVRWYLRLNFVRVHRVLRDAVSFQDFLWRGCSKTSDTET